MVEQFKREKGRVKVEESVEGREERLEEEREYKLLKREVKEQRGSGRVTAAVSAGMFDGLD